MFTRKNSHPNSSLGQTHCSPAKYRHLIIPQEVVSRTSRPALMLWSGTQQQILAFTLPWEDAVDEAYKRKMLRCAGMPAEVEKCGWKSQATPWMLRDHSRVGPTMR